MKKLLFLTAALLLSWGCIAQNDIVRYRACNECSNAGLDQNAPANQIFTYGNATEYPVNLVADDYGPRQNGTDTYDWHGGIDYNSATGNNDMGDLILAIGGGTITGSLGTGYKRLIVQAEGPNYGYGHLFISDAGNNALPLRSGGCWLMLDNDNRRCIVMVIDGVTTAIGMESGTVTFQGNIIPVNNVITAGDPVGPTGFSGLGNGAHLHLFSNPDNSVSIADDVTKNPLQYVSYVRPDYDIKMLRATNYTSNQTEDWTSPQYPGTNASHVVVRPQMLNESTTLNRYNSLYDLNQVGVLIKKRYEEDYLPIRGATHTSDIRIAGRIGQTILPTYMYDDGANPSIGNLTRQGIRPLAYATNGARPYDDFYFTDFITRIHKDDPMDGVPAMLSYCPMSTRYNDGRYQLKARVTDVRNRFEDADRDFIIDNYKPFIAHVRVQAGGLTFYERGWTCNDGATCQGMTLGQPEINAAQIGYSHLSGGMYVTATASEPLGELIMDAGTVVGGLQPYETEEDGRIQKFRINRDDALRLCSAGEIRFTFRGSDHSSNPILAFSTDNSSGCVRIPKRNSATAWTDDNISQTGGDVLHKVSGSCAPRFFTPQNETVFTISAGDDCHMVDGMVTHATNGASDGSISLTVTGLFDVEYQYMWSTGATTQHISGLAPGTYKVTVSDGLCCEVVEYFEVMECGNMRIEDWHAAIHPPSSCNASDGSLYFRFGGPTGGTAPYQMTLYGPGGNVIPTVPGAGWSNLSAGMYRLEVRDAIGCKHSESFELVGDSGFYIAGAVIELPCPGRADGIIELFIGGGENYLIEWSNGQTDETGIKDLEAGIYSVTITDGRCTIVETFDLSQPTFSPIEVNADIKNTCAGNGFDGRIILDVRGGAQPYSFIWNTGHTGDGISGVPAGTYCVTVTDRCGAPVSPCYTISNSSPMTVTGVVTPDCPEGSTGPNGITYHVGRIDLQVQGGTAPYRYQWSHGFSSTTNLSAGEYCVTVTDVAGCTTKKCFVVERSIMSIDINNLQHCMLNDCTGAFIDISVSGNTLAPYNYSWYFPPSGNIIHSGEDLVGISAPGTYRVHVRDARGCLVQRDIPISICGVVSAPIISGSWVIPVGGAFPNGAIFLDVLPSNGNYIYSWQGPNGFISNASELNPAAGVGVYTVTIRNGCGYEVSQTFEIRACNLNIQVINIMNECSGQGRAAVDLRITNISENDRFYGYINNEWRRLQTTFNVSNASATYRLEGLSEGTWRLRIINQNYCNGVVDFTISPSNTSTVSSPSVILSPNIVDFISNPNQLLAWRPSLCGVVVSCAGRIVDFIPTGTPTVTAQPTGVNTCQLQLHCGEHIIAQGPGVRVQTTELIGDKCREGDYCSFETLLASPLTAWRYGLPLQTHFPVRIRHAFSINRETNAKVEVELGSDGYCYVKKSCKDIVVEYQRTGRGDSRIECGSLHGHFNSCVEVIRCNNEIVRIEPRPELIPSRDCCFRAFQDTIEPVEKLLRIKIDRGNIETVKSITNEANPIFDGADKHGIIDFISEFKQGIETEGLISAVPNPFSDEVTLYSNDKSIDLMMDNAEIEIVDALGQLKRIVRTRSNEKGTLKLNMSNLAAGTYFVRVKLPNGMIQTLKLVKLS